MREGEGDERKLVAAKVVAVLALTALDGNELFPEHVCSVGKSRDSWLQAAQPAPHWRLGVVLQGLWQR
jgi:hypothetical protein